MNAADYGKQFFACSRNAFFARKLAGPWQEAENRTWKTFICMYIANKFKSGVGVFHEQFAKYIVGRKQVE